MKQAPSGLGRWRLTILTVGLVSLVTVALPAQAGLGDLLDDLLDPVEDLPVVDDIVDPIVDDVVDPIVEGIVDPIAGDLVDPIVDDVLAPALTPLVDTVVAPIVEGVVTPVLDNAVAPVIEPVVETITVGTTTTTALAVGASGQGAYQSAGVGVGPTSSGYPGGVSISDSPNDEALGAVQATTGLQSLEAALALQTALVASGSTEPSSPNLVPSTAMAPVDAGWLDGLTNWLRNGGEGLLAFLAGPIRLLELLARALLTAGSGLIAPLSMLLAFTAFLIKDRRWARAKP